VQAEPPSPTWVDHVVRAAAPARRGRTSLTLARLGLPTTPYVRAVGQPIAEALGAAVPWLDGHTEPASAPVLGPDLSEELGLQSLTALDAACASGLYALALAASSLQRGEVDCALAVAEQRCDSSYLFLGFQALRALSPTFRSRPLEADADGLVVGEGAVAVALKRLDDALADGDEVHAVLRGWGLGNDGRKGNLLAPSESGQARAMRAAWRRAGADPATLGYAELHATGTPVGDGVELLALQDLVGDAPLGSVHLGASKRLIGHTITVAGLAGLLRAVAAVRDGVRPATPVATPRAELTECPSLRVAPSPTLWKGRRRASVSAFGFGGCNAHVIVDAFDAGSPHPPLPRPRAVGLTIVAAAAAVGTSRDADVHKALGEPPRPAPTEVTRGLGDPRQGWWATEVRLDPSRYRIPPFELAEFLPQQLLALDLCADAAARCPDLVPERTGVVMRIAVDPAVAEPVVRWALTDHPDLAEAAHPELTASRVQGALPNVVANRIATQLDLQGPGYVVLATPDSATTIGEGGLDGGRQPVRAALDHARQLLADDPDLDAVVVGAVDVGARRGCDSPAEAPRIEGGCALVVRRGELPVDQLPSAPLPGDAGVAHDLLAVALASELPTPGAPGVLAVPHSLPPLPAPPYLGSWGGTELPAPRPRPPGQAGPPPRAEAGGVASVSGSLGWPYAAVPPVAARPATAPPPPRAPAAAPRPVPPPHVEPFDRGLHELARSVARQQARTADVHSRFLDQADRAQQHLARVADALSDAIRRLDSTPVQATPQPPPRLAPPLTPTAMPPPAPAPAPQPALRMDRADLLAHAGDDLSAAFGPAYADLDDYRPRCRLPLPPLLLVDRVLAIEGKRGHRGRARIVTEYDLPADAPWAAHDGHAPASIVVESGQADMLLASWLGVDEICRGERVYRLLDCDLDFQAPLPTAGTTLHHDIRIDRFVTLGDKLLFYFQYDCTTVAGDPVLAMRNGCAGFFTPAELADPRGCPADPGDHPTKAPLPALAQGTRGSLTDAQVRALRQGRFGDALDQPEADGRRLTLPDTDWCLVHRVTELTRSGGPHGLGRVVFEQDLRDDDWFNPCHFLDDPCMPGTLMFEGCLQAVQLWLLGLGAAAVTHDGRFEPIPGQAAQLRCRGQVVPGHRKLTYTAYITDAGVSPLPWAVADVVLHCDGVPVVRAEGVGVRVVGEPVASRPVSGRRSEAIDDARVMEYSIGSVARAFGEHLASWDAPDTRVARMPGPPYLTMSRVVEVEGEQGVVAFPRSVSIAYDVPDDDWYFQATGPSVPFAYLLEIALQPCGWLTAWQGAGLDAELRFRNLGGELTLHQEVPRGAGTLVTTVTQTSVSTAGALQVQFFDLHVALGDTVILEGTTHFGYFDRTALSGQKGLGLPARSERSVPLSPPVALADHPALPRSDWRVIDEVVSALSEGGAHGQGFYAARAAVDVHDWHFTAHFFLDPVMPGSLGLEAILQLAAWVHAERTGAVRRLQPLATGAPVSWKYRGQVLPGNDVMEVELDVVHLDADRITVDGVIRADGLPIYRLDGASLAAAPPPLVHDAPPPPRDPVAALLDSFAVDGDQGVGHLHLDPAVHPWLDQHRPTLTAAALPLAFAAEIAAEAASLLATGHRVVAIPQLEASAWVHTADGPTDLLVAAVRSEETVAVTLSIHEDNPRYPKLSGPKVKMRAVVQLAPPEAGWCAPQEVPPTTTDDEHDVDAYYGGGHTFHGPVLQAMTSLRSGEGAAEATLAPAADADVLGLPGHRFVLDPVLLDAATHPMRSGSPEVWHPELGPGHLAYPVRCEGLRLHGPRPSGEVRQVLRQAPSEPDQLVFDVWLLSAEGPWCSFRWVEAITPAGLLLGLPAAERRAMLFDRQPVAHAVVGHRHAEGGWEVDRDDLIEPMEGTVVGQCSSSAERKVWRGLQGPERTAWTLARLAAKGAARAHLQHRLGRDIHPAELSLLAMRADRYVLVSCPALTAQEWVDHLGPTRWHLCVDGDQHRARAWVEPADERGRPPFAGLAVPATRGDGSSSDGR